MKLIKTPDDTSPVFLCPVCGQAWSQEREAEACSASGGEVDRRFLPGTLVIWSIQYGWTSQSDLAKAWVYDWEGQPFHGKKTVRVWGFITAVEKAAPAHAFFGDQQAHKVRYHVATRAILNSDLDDRRLFRVESKVAEPSYGIGFMFELPPKTVTPPKLVSQTLEELLDKKERD